MSFCWFKCIMGNSPKEDILTELLKRLLLCFLVENYIFLSQIQSSFSDISLWKNSYRKKLPANSL